MRVMCAGRSEIRRGPSVRFLAGRLVESIKLMHPAAGVWIRARFGPTPPVGLRHGEPLAQGSRERFTESRVVGFTTPSGATPFLVAFFARVPLPGLRPERDVPRFLPILKGETTALFLFFAFFVL